MTNGGIDELLAQSEVQSTMLLEALFKDTIGDRKLTIDVVR